MTRSLRPLAAALLMAVALAGCDSKPTTGGPVVIPKDEGKQNTERPPAPSPPPM